MSEQKEDETSNSRERKEALWRHAAVLGAWVDALVRVIQIVVR